MKKILKLLGICMILIVFTTACNDNKKGKEILEEINELTYEPRSYFSDGLILEDTSIILVGAKIEFDESKISAVKKGILVKYDLDGNKILEKTYAEEGDVGITSIKRYGEGYVISLSIYNNKTNETIIAILDSNGEVTNQIKLSKVVRDIQIKGDKLLCIGYNVENDRMTNSTFFQCNSNLEIEWEKNNGTLDGFSKLICDGDRYIILASNHNRIIEYDLNGNEINSRYIGTFQNYTSITITDLIVANSSYYIVGYGRNGGSEPDNKSFLIKLDFEGNIEKMVFSKENLYFYKLNTYSDNLIGYSYQTISDNDYVIDMVVLDYDGNILNQITLNTQNVTEPEKIIVSDNIVLTIETIGYSLDMRGHATIYK